MRTFARGLLAAGLLAVGGAAALGYGFEGTFDDIAAAIGGSEHPSAAKIQNFIEKESVTLSKDFITFSKVAREAEKTEFTVLSLETIETEFGDMVTRSGEFGAAAFIRMGDALASAPDPKTAARIYKKQLRYIAKQGKAMAKYQEAYASADYAKAAVFYAAVQKLFEAVDRAFPNIG